jgi:hypothetical protein
VLTREIAERGDEGTIRCRGSGEGDGAGAIHQGRHRGFDCGHGVGCREMNQVCRAGVEIQGFKGALAIVAPAVRMNDKRQTELAVIARAAATELATLWPLRSLSMQRHTTSQGGGLVAEMLATLLGATSFALPGAADPVAELRESSRGRAPPDGRSRIG